MPNNHLHVIVAYAPKREVKRKIMKSHILCILGLLVALLPFVSEAEIIQIDFSGVITELPEGFASELVSIGTSLNGFLQYDDELPSIPSTLQPPIYSFGGPVQFSALVTNGETITQLDWSYAEIRIHKDDGIFESEGDIVSIRIQSTLMIIGRPPIQSVTLIFKTIPGSSLKEQALETATPLLLNGSLSSNSIGIRVQGDRIASYARGAFEYTANTEWAGFKVFEDGSSVNTGSWLGWVDITYKPFVYIYLLSKYVYLPENNINIAGGWMWVPDES